MTTAVLPMPAADYFRDYSSWSQSMIKTFATRRRLAQAYYVLQTEVEPADSDPMRKGTATHTALLEPERFDELVVVYPRSVLDKKGNCTTNASEDFFNEQTVAGRTVLKQKQFEAVQAMAASVRRVCGRWLDLPGEKEQVIRWTDEYSGLPLKARIDWIISLQTPIIFDLKTTADASPYKFRKRIEDGRYWLQAAQYIDAVRHATGCPESPEFYFIAVESEFPFACAMHTLDRASLLAAYSARRRLLNDLNACLATNSWEEPWETEITRLPLRDFAFDNSL